MQDIDNVGKTGRHTMAFEMMAHHAFNTREEVAEDEYAYHGEVYWKDETVEYCDKLFESLGADLRGYHLHRGPVGRRRERRPRHRGHL